MIKPLQRIINIINSPALFKHIIVIFFCYDFITKLLVHYFKLVIFFNYAIVFKSTMVLLSVFYLGKKHINEDIIKIVFLLTVSFIFGFFSLYSFFTKEDVLFNGYYFLGSVIPLIFLIFFYYYDKALILEYLVNSFLILMTINAIFVFSGLIFDVNIFKSYWRGGGRYGYQGLLLYHSEAGYLFFIAINIAYYNYKKYKGNLQKLTFILIFLSSLFVGTKKAILLSLIFLVYFLVENRKNLLSNYAIKIYSLVLLIFILFHKILTKVFMKQYYLFYEIYKERGFLSSFFSFRNILFKEKFSPYIKEQWSTLNYIFGGPAFSRFRVELEFFDIYLFFGLIGLISYYILFKKILKNRNYLIYFMSLSMIVASLFSGNFVSRVNVLVIFFICINYVSLNPKLND